ncbi:MAG: hypothetical protein HY537_06330 [Deltaproteobacteria bacterium]|nr:hypothetical protein [Deltaproteobacteria bacterium]
MNQKLLVLDDEKDVLDSYRLVFSPPKGAPTILSSRRLTEANHSVAEQTFEITYVSTGEAALGTIADALNNGSSFVGGFFDVKLGAGIDGIETIRQAKIMDPSMYCVIVTAFQDRSINEIRKILGDDFTDHWDYLSKPFSSAEIFQKAFHIVASWNRKTIENQRMKDLETRQQQAAIIRDLLDDLVAGIQGNAKQALGNTPDPALKKILDDILLSATNADRILRDVLTRIAPESQTKSKAA